MEPAEAPNVRRIGTLETTVGQLLPVVTLMVDATEYRSVVTDDGLCLAPTVPVLILPPMLLLAIPEDVVGPALVQSGVGFGRVTAGG